MNINKEKALAAAPATLGRHQKRVNHPLMTTIVNNASS